MNGARLCVVGRSASGGAGIGDQIEFLTPRDSAFGGDHPVDFAGIDIDDLPPPDDEVPRSRWLTGAAALLVVALVGVGIVAAAPWSSSDTALPPPTTIVPPETTIRAAVIPAASTVPTVAFVPPTGLVFDPLPPGFAIREAFTNAVDPASTDNSGQSVPGWGEVWATPDATRTTGSWFSVALLNGPYYGTTTSATRVDLSGRIGLLHELDGGVLRLTAPVPQARADQTLTVTSFGRTADQLIALFDSIAIDADRPPRVDDRPVFTDRTLIDGLNQVASGATQSDLVDQYLGGSVGSSDGQTSTFYSNGTDDQGISILTSPRDDTLDPLARLAITPLTEPPAGVELPMLLDQVGEAALGQQQTGDRTLEVVRWHANDTTVVVRSTLDMAVLLPLLSTLRSTTAAEWAVVEQRAQDAATASAPDAVGPEATQQLTSGTLDDGTAWSAGLRPPGSVSIDTSRIGLEIDLTSSSTMPITVWTTDSAVYVVGYTPGATAPSVLRVSQGDGQMIEATMDDISLPDSTPAFRGRIGVLEFQRTGAFQVDIVAQDGSIVSHFSSPGSDA